MNILQHGTKEMYGGYTFQLRYEFLAVHVKTLNEYLMTDEIPWRNRVEGHMVVHCFKLIVNFMVNNVMSSCVLDRKTNMTLQRFLFSFLPEREIQRNLCQAG